MNRDRSPFSAFAKLAAAGKMKPCAAPDVLAGAQMALIKAFVDAPNRREPEEARRYVKVALSKFLRGAGSSSMECAFGVQAAPSTRSAVRAFAQTQYEEALLNAWQALPARTKSEPDNPFPWGDVERFLVEIDQFEKDLWVQWQKSGLPKKATEIQARLFLACERATRIRHEVFAAKGLHPKSVKAMRELLTRAAALT
jgi:hypothetical protein